MILGYKIAAESFTYNTYQSIDSSSIIKVLIYLNWKLIVGKYFRKLYRDFFYVEYMDKRARSLIC